MGDRDPTPSEIADGCMAAQEKWTDAERDKRAGRQPQPWTPPQVRSLPEGELSENADDWWKV